MNIFQVETWLRLVIKLNNTVQQYMKAFRLLTLFHLGFLRMPQLGGGGGGGNCPRTITLKLLMIMEYNMVE